MIIQLFLITENNKDNMIIPYLGSWLWCSNYSLSRIIFQKYTVKGTSTSCCGEEWEKRRQTGHWNVEWQVFLNALNPVSLTCLKIRSKLYTNFRANEREGGRSSQSECSTNSQWGRGLNCFACAACQKSAPWRKAFWPVWPDRIA